MARSILHCDMNNFYASVECMMDPSLKGKAVAVCGLTEERHGVVLAKNEAAKAFGVKTGEATWEARKKCPALVIVHPHHELYKKYSLLAREIYGRYTDRIEPFGLDECWLDVGGSIRLFGQPEEIADEIRRTVKAELGLTVSVGVSFNKIFAKLGSDLKKPDAVTCIFEESFREQIWPLPAGEMLGVGPGAASVLAKYGIHTIGQLAAAPDEFLRQKFGKSGAVMKLYANGLDDSPVRRADENPPPKSVGHGLTAAEDIVKAGDVNALMISLAQDVGKRLRSAGMKARGVSVTVRDSTLAAKEWQCRMPFPTASPTYIAREAFALFCRSYAWASPVRAVTVRAIDLCDENDPYQLSLDGESEEEEKRERLDGAISRIRDAFGSGALKNACLIGAPNRDGDEL